MAAAISIAFLAFLAFLLDWCLLCLLLHHPLPPFFRFLIVGVVVSLLYSPQTIEDALKKEKQRRKARARAPKLHYTITILRRRLSDGSGRRGGSV